MYSLMPVVLRGSVSCTASGHSEGLGSLSMVNSPPAPSRAVRTAVRLEGETCSGSSTRERLSRCEAACWGYTDEHEVDHSATGGATCS